MLPSDAKRNGGVLPPSDLFFGSGEGFFCNVFSLSDAVSICIRLVLYRLEVL